MARHTCEYCDHVFNISDEEYDRLVECPACQEMCDAPAIPRESPTRPTPDNRISGEKRPSGADSQHRGDEHGTSVHKLQRSGFLPKHIGGIAASVVLLVVNTYLLSQDVFDDVPIVVWSMVLLAWILYDGLRLASKLHKSVVLDDTAITVNGTTVPWDDISKARLTMPFVIDASEITLVRKDGAKLRISGAYGDFDRIWHRITYYVTDATEEGTPYVPS